MALFKEIIKENGAVSNYHKISSITLNTNEDANRLSVLVESFVNKEYRKKNCAIDLTNYMFNITNTEDAELGIRALGYKKLKEVELFDGAEDC